MSTEFSQQVDALKGMGVHAVGLGFAPGVASMPKAAVTSGVREFLNAYLAGRFQRLEALGDAPGRLAGE